MTAVPKCKTMNILVSVLNYKQEILEDKIVWHSSI